jgi:hypothetical protein
MLDPLTFVIGGVLLILLMAALTQPKDRHPDPALSIAVTSRSDVAKASVGDTSE